MDRNRVQVRREVRGRRDTRGENAGRQQLPRPSKVVAEVFSKSVITTALISPAQACISELKIVEIALVFEDA